MRWLAASFAVLVVLPGLAPAQDVEVGVARVDITPEGPIRLHGYLARSEESRGVDRRIGAQALAIGDDGQGPLLLVTVDNLGVPAEVVATVAGLLKEKAGLSRERFAVASSHTHSAPMLAGTAPNIFGKPLLPDQQAKVDRYTRELTDKLESVALEALRAREPGSIAFGRGRVGFAANRRTPGGPVDHDVPILVASGPRGVRAILAAYACHCTSLDPGVNRIHGDWAGEAREGIEAAFPGCTALIAIGCGADSNPSPRGRLEDAQAHGRALADEVRRVVAEGTQPHAVKRLEARLETIQIPLDTLPTREELEALVKAGGPPGYNARTQLDRLDRGEKLRGEIDYTVQCWAIDDARAFVFLAGEVVVDYSLRLKKELDGDRLWVIAYANDAPCYIPSERILREGGYEGGGAMVYYGLPTRIRPGVEDRIIEAVHRLIPPAFRASGKR